MVGRPGTGKSFTIQGFLAEFHKLLKERIGLEDVGSRVLRIKLSEVLSEYFSVSDRPSICPVNITKVPAGMASRRAFTPTCTRSNAGKKPPKPMKPSR